MRREIFLNNDWLFLDQKVAIDTPDQDFTGIDLPHSNKIFKHHNIDNAQYQTIRNNFV